MKRFVMRIGLLTIILGAPLAIVAQSLAIVSGDSIVYGNAYTSTDIPGYVEVMNVGSTDKEYRVKRIDANYNALTDSNAICWDICFDPVVSVSPSKIMIKAGEIYSGFSGHVYPDGDGNALSGPITYVFFDANDPNDSITYTITYSVTPNFSIGEAKKNSIVSVYPNPVDDWLTVEYEGNAKNRSFSIKNIVGKTVVNKQLSNDFKEYRIDMSSLVPGVYFYELKEDGKTIETKKLVVR